VVLAKYRRKDAIGPIGARAAQEAPCAIG